MSAPEKKKKPPRRRKLFHVITAITNMHGNKSEAGRIVEEMAGLAKSIREMRLTKYKFEKEASTAVKNSKWLKSKKDAPTSKQEARETQSSDMSREKSPSRPKRPAKTSRNSHKQTGESCLLSLMEEVDRVTEISPKIQHHKIKGDIEVDHKSLLHVSDIELKEYHLQLDYLHKLQRDFNISNVTVRSLEEAITNGKAEIDELDKREKYISSNMLRSTKTKAQMKLMNSFGPMQESFEYYTRYKKTLLIMKKRLEQDSKIYNSKAEKLKSLKRIANRNLKTLQLELSEAESKLQRAKSDAQIQEKRFEEKLIDWMGKLRERQMRISEYKRIMRFRSIQAERSKTIVANVKGDLNKEGEKRLKDRVSVAKAKQSQLQKDISDCSDKVDEYEIAFRRIINSTGINSTTEVVNKYINQDSTRNNLLSMIDEITGKIKVLTKEKEAATSELERYRFSGFGTYNKHRKLLDEKEEKIKEVKKSQEILKLKSKTISELIDGIELVSTKVVHFIDSLGNPTADAPSDFIHDQSQIPINDKEAFSDFINSCESRIHKFLVNLPSKFSLIQDVDNDFINAFSQTQIMIKRPDNDIDSQLEEDARDVNESTKRRKGRKAIMKKRFPPRLTVQHQGAVAAVDPQSIPTVSSNRVTQNMVKGQENEDSTIGEAGRAYLKARAERFVKLSQKRNKSND